MRALCLRTSVERQHFSSAFSVAHVLSWLLFALALVLPLLLAHGSHDFWARARSYREQPRVALTYSVLSVLEGVSVDPATQAQEHVTIVQTTFPTRVQQLLQSHTRASQFKSYEVDDDRDGVADELHVEITTPLAPHERIHHVTLLAVLNFTLQGRVKMTMDAMAMHTQSSALAGESLYVDGTLMLEQREPLHLKSSVQTPYSRSPLLNISKIQTAQDLSLRALVTQYRKRECAAYFQSPHPVWATDVSHSTLATPRPRQFHTHMVVRIPTVDVLYYPSWAEVLKLAWIQYYCLFVVVSTLTSFLCAFLIKSKVVDTFAVLDDPALALAKKRL